MAKDTQSANSQADYEDACSFATLTRGTGMLQLAAGLVPKFTGQDKTYSAAKWVQDVEDNGEIFGWTPVQQLLIARRSLGGSAELWLRSEKTFKTWEELKNGILKEFPDLIDAKTAHEMMSARKKQGNESCLDYLFVMKEMGKRGKMADYVAIKYIVEGIEDDEVNKIMLYGVTSYAELKEKLKIYEQLKENIRSKQASEHTQRQSSSSTRGARLLRCYSCGETNHASADCPHQDKGIKCFRCNDFGHIASKCTKFTQERGEMSTSRRTSDTNAPASRQKSDGGATFAKRNFVGLCHVTNEDSCDRQTVGSTDSKMTEQRHDGDFTVLNVNKISESRESKNNKSMKTVKILNGSSVNASVDTGSEVNLMSTEYYQQIGFPKCVNNIITLTGLGQSKVSSMGQFSVDIEIDDCIYSNVIFHVIPGYCIPVNVILGQEFLQEVVMIMRDGSVSLMPNEDKRRKCLPCDVDSGIMNKVLENDESFQTKEVQKELKISTKGDIQIAQRSQRRAPRKQRDANISEDERYFYKHNKKCAKKQSWESEQEENKKVCSENRKQSCKYKENLVVMEWTQISPHWMTEVKRSDYYNVEDAEGPDTTSGFAGLMKPWPEPEEE